MGRYISIFLLTILATLGLFMMLLMIIGDTFELELITGIVLVALGSFIITQLFYIIELLMKKS
ncbi:hypothetical protein J7E71_16910 [Mesobacillus foraminis]|uniref:hypothetical protein n=1 Tax=Mesobacillus foraminis TaxID=279826 RepID=UPI001BE86013|nr:hypothetical protein [Mesobacillus foraminis]MBT2757573.1 hypothetical protein [Mesobacillus foraminis]